MGLFFVYTLKSSVCLALFYLFYRLLLTKETFHRFNRIFLLGLMLLSMIIPFCEITLSDPAMLQHPAFNWQQLLLLAHKIEQAPTPWLGWQIIQWLYVVGGLVFLCQALYSMYQIGQIIRLGERRELANNQILVLTQEKISPFSWMNYIMIAQTDWEESGTEILAHEMAHVTLRHSWDVCLVGLSTILYWYNPAIWLLKQELQNIHEYEADEAVINQGINAKKYQLLLIKKAVGSERFTSMVNSFNHSKLKKRITMMLKSKSSPWARLKYAYVLPLAAVAIVAFARPEIAHEFEKISNTQISKVTNNAATSPSTEHVASLDSTKKAAQLKPVDNSIVVVGYGKEGANQPVELGKEGANPLVICDGVEISLEEMKKMNPNDILSISVIKDGPAVKEYGEKAKDGVIIIKLNQK